MWAATFRSVFLLPLIIRRLSGHRLGLESGPFLFRIMTTEFHDKLRRLEVSTYKPRVEVTVETGVQVC